MIDTNRMIDVSVYFAHQRGVMLAQNQFSESEFAPTERDFIVNMRKVMGAGVAHLMRDLPFSGIGSFIVGIPPWFAHHMLSILPDSPEEAARIMSDWCISDEPWGRFRKGGRRDGKK